MICTECDGEGICRYVSGDGHTSWGICHGKDCKRGVIVNEWNEDDETKEPVPPIEQEAHAWH